MGRVGVERVGEVGLPDEIFDYPFRRHLVWEVVKAYLAKHPEIVVEDFPGYAPELNPVELVWCWTKYGRLCNYAAADLKVLRERVLAELDYLYWHPYELLDFVRHTPLPLTG